MENSFIKNMKEQTNFTYTENGGVAHKSTLDKVYDLFALGGAYRKRSDEDCILLFKNALEQDETLAVKCLFYLRDVRGGQGERRFFRVCLKWLSSEHPEIVKRNLEFIPEYGRYDDLLVLLFGTNEKLAIDFIKEQLEKDIESANQGDNYGVSLLGKWMPSENASSIQTKEYANRIRKVLGLSHKNYRKLLTQLRKRINIVETLMSQNRWEEIQFDKIPSKAGLIYKNAFAHKDCIAEKYEEFINSKETKVNAKALYPYEIVKQVTSKMDYWRDTLNIEETDRKAIEKYWNNLPDYLKGNPMRVLCVVDTSGSMRSGNGSAEPIDVAISLGMYCAERIGEPFKNNFISFSSRPSFIEIEGIDFADKVARIYKQNLCENTDLIATFELVKNVILEGNVPEEEQPETIVVISDMEIDGGYRYHTNIETEMEAERKEWERCGLRMPRLVYWNVDARNNIILDKGPNVSCVSGCSPILFESVLTGKSGIDLMLEKLNSERYENIK